MSRIEMSDEFVHTTLQEVFEMPLEDGEPEMEADFIGTQTVMVA